MHGERPRTRRILTGLIALGLTLLVIDMWRPPERQISAAATLGVIAFYQTHLASHSPSHCRFTPTCSEYARLAITKYGSAKGGLLSAWRIVRCSPFTTRRGEDYP